MLQEIAMFERSVHGEDAEKAILSMVAGLEKTKGYKFHHYKKKTTDVVYVEDADGNEITYGLGKGIQSKLGAYGECLEHLFYQDIGRSNTVPVTTEEFKKSRLHEDDCLVQYLMTLDGAPKSLDCLPFEILQDGSKFYVPNIMMNYHFLEHDRKKKEFEIFLGRYVTTSGTAFALTKADAYLHALNETIERDITSDFFLEISKTGYGADGNFARLSTNELPSHMATLLNDIKDRHGASDIDIVISKTKHSTWWSFCVARFPQGSQFLLPEWGAGNSLLYDLAIYRSISEVIQMLDNYEDENKDEHRKFMDFVSRYPKFKPVASLDYSELNLPVVEYDGQNNIAPISVEKQIDIITKSMKDSGYYASAYTAHESQHGHVQCAFTPNLERFYNITKATFVLPLQHIKKYLA